LVIVSGLNGTGYAKNYNKNGQFDVVKSTGESWMTYRTFGIGW